MRTPSASQRHPPKNLLKVVIASRQQESASGDGEELMSELLVEVGNESDDPETETGLPSTLDVIRAALMPRRPTSRGTPKRIFSKV
jgi:hypothetical protein